MPFENDRDDDDNNYKDNDDHQNERLREVMLNRSQAVVLTHVLCVLTLSILCKVRGDSAYPASKFAAIMLSLCLAPPRVGSTCGFRGVSRGTCELPGDGANDAERVACIAAPKATGRSARRKKSLGNL